MVRLAAVLACLIAVSGCTATIVEHEPIVDSTPVSAVEFDVTDMTLLQGTWWTWAMSEPEETNPVADTTGEDCDRGQSPGVWLVAGSFGETVTRRCTVPSGVPLAGPAINLIVDSDSQADCAEFVNAAQGTVTFDDVAVPLTKADPTAVVYHSVAGNPVNGQAGDGMGLACGLWFSVSDPERGDHVLRIQGSSEGFSVSVTYELTVS